MNEKISCGMELCTSKIELFEKLPLNVQEEIVHESEHFDSDKNSIIVQEGDLADSIFVIREGKVKCNRYDADGKEYILDILMAGDTIGEEFFMQKERFEYNIIPLVPSKLCKISKSQLFSVLAENGEWALSFLDVLSNKLSIANEKIRILMEDNGLRRMIAFFIERDHRLQGEPITLSLEEIAGMTNLRRETVSRKIKELQDKGLIERLGQKQIKVVDREKLMEIFYES
ncbi:MAG: Crp/Fnr family transcriptional regulator [Tissierellia bacterium]|nr:Crp/Fnr family transcriptional regulator [Tissierellia bacterium]